MPAALSTEAHPPMPPSHAESTSGEQTTRASLARVGAA
jgi:hypothetical protein